MLASASSCNDAVEDEGEDLGWPAKTVAAARTLIEHHLDDLLQNRLPKVAEDSASRWTRSTKR